MALGAQSSPVYALVTLALWLRRNGYRVGELHGFTDVNPVHLKGSWHYDVDPSGFGKAMDVNWPDPAAERPHLIHAVGRAHELGLATIYARDGSAGPARTHTRHLHVDVGPLSYLGAGPVRARGGGDTVTVAVQEAVRAVADGVWGEDTNHRVSLVQYAAHHTTTPHGVAAMQTVVGADGDGVWGPATTRALRDTVAAMQRALGVPDDGLWGPRTQSAFAYAWDLRYRR